MAKRILHVRLVLQVRAAAAVAVVALEVKELLEAMAVVAPVEHKAEMEATGESEDPGVKEELHRAAAEAKVAWVEWAGREVRYRAAVAAAAAAVAAVAAVAAAVAAAVKPGPGALEVKAECQ